MTRLRPSCNVADATDSSKASTSTKSNRFTGFSSMHVRGKLEQSENNEILSPVKVRRTTSFLLDRDVSFVKPKAA